jgi:hypothetical protein
MNITKKILLGASLSWAAFAQSIDVVDVRGFLRTATLGENIKLVEKDGKLIIDVAAPAPAPDPNPNPNPTPSPLPTPAVPTLYLFTSGGPAPIEIGTGLVLANVDGKFKLSIDPTVFVASIGFKPGAAYVPVQKAVELALNKEIPALGWCEGKTCLVNICGTQFKRVLVEGTENRKRVLALNRPSQTPEGSISSKCE